MTFFVKFMKYSGGSIELLHKVNVIFSNVHDILEQLDVCPILGMLYIQLFAESFYKKKMFFKWGEQAV